MASLLDGEKNMFIAFDRIHKCDRQTNTHRQTDGQTDTAWRHRPRLHSNKMHVTCTPQKVSYLDFFDTVHLVFWDLVLPPDEDVTPTEVPDGLLLTTSISVTWHKTPVIYFLQKICQIWTYKNTAIWHINSCPSMFYDYSFCIYHLNMKC